MLVPGAGQPNFDSRVAAPYQAKRARREQEVHQLLDKLRPDMIVLDPTTLGQVLPSLQGFSHECRTAHLHVSSTKAARQCPAVANSQAGKLTVRYLVGVMHWRFKD